MVPLNLGVRGDRNKYSPAMRQFLKLSKVENLNLNGYF